MEPQPIVELKKPSSLPLVILSILLLFSLVASGILYTQNSTLQQQIETLTISPTISKIPPTNTPTNKPSPAPTEIITPPAQNAVLKVGSNWQTYTDEAAGITIQYPPELTAKYNSNRGAAFQYMAGSYLVGSDGNHLMDFYFYTYNGGSRREAFYDAVEFDGPENVAGFTKSATDISLNGKTFLKITTTYTSEAEPRIFYLIPQGNRLYYFTYSQAVEKNSTLTKTLQTIIATSILNSSSQAFATSDNLDKQVWCSATKDFLKEKGDTWDARLDDTGDMVVIQRLNYALKSKAVRKEYVDITANPQTSSVNSWEIPNYALMVDTSEKGNYQDALVLTIPKTEVDKIVKATPNSIASISVMLKINEALETVTGETCRPFSAPEAYFTNKP